MSKDDPFGRFTLAFAFSVVLLAPPILLTGWIATRFGCGSGQSAGIFIAYCQSDKFGDYEHGAYALGLEPVAIENLKRAQVLFLGNSKTQFGFSTDAVRAFFRELDIRHYVFGFAYSEMSPFAEFLIAQLHLRPKVLVINADPFFALNTMSAPARNVIAPSFQIRLVYLLKKHIKHLWELCTWTPGLCQTYRSIYRSAEDGHYDWSRTFLRREQERLIPATKQVEIAPATIEVVKKLAEQFLQRSTVPPSCIILTGLPNEYFDPSPMVRALASHLGAPFVLPAVDGLSTQGGSHLTLPSAEQWSAAVLAEAAPIIKRCSDETSP